MRKDNESQHLSWVKLCCFVFVLLVFQGNLFAQAQDDYKETRVTLRVDNMPLGEVLDTLATMTDVKFFYNHSQIDVNKKLSLDLKERTLNYVLIVVLADQAVDIDYQSNRVIVLKAKPKQETQVVGEKVDGQVIDAETKDPLPGASIVLKETPGVGMTTDIDGKFQLDVPQGVTALLVSFVGYEDEEVPLTGNLSNLSIKLSPKQEELEDVVVTGMAPRKVEGFTGTYVTVKGEQLKKLNPNNILSALQLFDPSFRIVENNERGSDPNALPEFRMRGDVQLGDSAPTEFQMMMGDYSNRPNMPLFILDGFEASLQRIVDLDPERIESVTILKDAAATAIYGSRASNGVLVFETRPPLPGRLNIAYSLNMAITAPDLTDYNLMNAAEKLEYERQAGLFRPNNAAEMNYYNEKLQEVLRGVDTYWLSKPLRTPFMHSHSLSMEGGDETIRYSLALNYSSNPGVMKGSDNTTMGLDLTLNYQRKGWNIQNVLSLSNREGNNSPYGDFSEYTKANPYYRDRDENGNLIKEYERKSMGVGYSSVLMTNPLWDAQFPHKDKNVNFSVTNNFAVEWAILENLRLNAAVSFTKGIARNERFTSANDTEFAPEDDLTRKGRNTKSVGENFDWSVNASASYNWVKDRHTVMLYGRWEATESTSNSVNLTAYGFPNDNMTDFLFAFEMEDRASGDETTSRSVGVVGQVSYMYDMRYSVDFSVRGDISSQFGDNAGMAPFWAVGFRWNAYNEPWLKNTFVSNLVVHGSYGITGSQSYEPYQAVETYSFENLMFPYPTTDVLGAQLMGIGNPDLGWSKTKNTSVGIELGLFNNRLNASASYYHNLTDNLLMQYTLPPSVGFQNVTMNLGSVLNEGVDLSLNGLLINDYTRGIQWSLGVNAAHNRNVIKEISNRLEALNEQRRESVDDPQTLYEEGKSTSGLYTVPSLGIDPATGQELYLKRDGSKTFVWDPADKIYIGETTPKWNGAINSSFIWKNWSVALGFTYTLGEKYYNQTLVDKIENARAGYNLDKRALTHRWSETNRNAKYKAITINGSNTPQSSRFVQDRNTLTFSSITAGYRFDQSKYNFLKACRISSCNLNFSMNDVAVLSTVKTERGLEYPYARTFNLSLGIVFN